MKSFDHDDAPAMGDAEPVYREVRRIKRDAALALLRSQGRDDSDRLRNYEIEARLRRLPGAFAGIDWIVDESCPFDGRFCRWGDMEGARSE